MTRSDPFTSGDRSLLLKLLLLALQGPPCPYKTECKHNRLHTEGCDQQQPCALWAGHIGECRSEEDLLCLQDKLREVDLARRVALFVGRNRARIKRGLKRIPQSTGAHWLGISRETLSRALAREKKDA